LVRCSRPYSTIFFIEAGPLIYLCNSAWL